ncbi:unnamed protein product [Allacma fusca]|uniref:Cytochrome b5 heme-binding domain-containing protein n=1 Tax=Allacma fusca TaxID=39272 RepID=A0A8J2KP98_9HEXA|nr:unnamed protein product [Allacma fusca]
MGPAASWISDKDHPQGKYIGPSQHSSFPGISRSTDKRGIWCSTAETWLRGKRDDDDIDRTLWRVHDKLYDLTKFIDRHPGGSDWLSMTRGMDITELFENSHVIEIDKVEATLKKFFVQDAPHPRNSPYTFEPDGFYKTLKRRVEPILKEKGTGPTVKIRVMQDLMVAGFVIFSLLGVIRDSYWPFIVAGLSLGFSSVSAHNFFHIRDNWRKYYFDLSLCSHYEWRIEHVFSHHAFTNTAWDAEVLWLTPGIEFLANRSKNLIQRFGSWVYIHVVFAFLFHLSILFRIICILKGTTKFRPEFFLPVVQLFLIVGFAKSGIVHGFLFWMLAHMICSYWVAMTGMNAAHHHPICFHDGDESRPKPDYGLCMLDATGTKVEDINKSLFQLMTTFGEHHLHHLFPAVCISKLGHIKPIVEETVLEFKEEMIFLNQWELLKGMHEQLARVEPHSFQTHLEQRRQTQRQAVWSTKAL